MAERVVRVSLIANVNNYIANMDAAQKSTKKVGDTLEAQKAASIAAAKAQGEAMAAVGRGLVVVGALAAVGVALAVKKFADFDQAMSNVQAATNETTENMGLLRAAAIQAGLDTAYSAGEAADAVTELAKAGVATADILGGALTGALSLAAAGEISVARAAEIAATAMTQFKLKGTQVSHVADLLSSGANKAQGGVEDLSGALSQGGLVAAATGLSIEETVGTLSAFASAGLLGSDAGTSFKSMLQRLTPISKESKDKMDELGISAYDAQGSFIGMEKFAGNLRTSLKDLTPEQRNAAQAVIFGTDAVRASNILYEQGASGIGKWISEVDDSGAAARTAAIKLDNLNGDLQILGGSFETALIQTGSGANDVLRALTQGATGLVNVVGGLPQPVLAGGLALGGLVAVIGLAGGTALIALPKLAALRASMITLGVSARTAAVGVGILSGALLVVGVAFTVLASKQAELTSNTGDFKDSLDQATGAVTDYTRELVLKKLTEKDAFDGASKAGVSQGELTDAVLLGGDAFEKVDKKLRDYHASLGLNLGEMVPVGNTINDLKDLHLVLRDGEIDWKNETAAVDENGESLAVHTERVEAEAKATGEWKAALQEQDAAFINIGGAYDAVIQKNMDLAQSTADSTESSEDSWEDYYDGFSVANGDYLAELQAQVDAQTAWESNMVTLAGKVSAGTLTELSKLGPEGAPLVAQLVAMSDAELAEAEGLFAQRADQATGAFAQHLMDAQTLVALAGAQLGQGAATEIAAKLAAGTHTVADIIREYKLNIEGTPFQVRIETDIAKAKLAELRTMVDGLAAKGFQVARGLGGAGGMTIAQGAVIDYYARGGLRENHIAQIAPAGAWRVWAEPETGGESYIPLALSKRQRSLEIWEETGHRLGVAGYANGYVTPVQYAPQGPSWSGMAPSTSRSEKNINITVPAIQNPDPRVSATIIGRQIARELAG